MKNPTYCYKLLADAFDEKDPTGLTGEMYQTAMRFAQDYIAPYERDMWDSGVFRKELWQQMGAMGFTGVMMPAEGPYEGSGQGYLQMYAVLSGISYGSGSVGLSALANQLLGMDRLHAGGSDELKQSILPDAIAGNTVMALAMTEPDAGSDVVKSMRSKAVHTMRDGVDGFAITGSKLYITNAPGADYIVTYAKTTPDTITAFAVKTDTPGLTVGPRLDKTGMRGSETSEVFYDDCWVPATHIVGGLDCGEALLKQGLLGERFGLAVIGDGIMRNAIDCTLQHTASRKQFGKTLNNYQGITFPVADAINKLDALQAQILDMAHAGDVHETRIAQGKKSRWNPARTASLFLTASQAACDVTVDCQRLTGGMGYMHDYPIGRCVNDAILLATGGGTENVRRMLIGNDAYKHQPG